MLLISLLLLSGSQLLQAQLLTQTNFTGVIVPQFMASGTSTRLPVIYRATVSGLTPNTVYRYYTRGAATTDFGTTNDGAGNSVLINAGSGVFLNPSSPAISVVGGYDTFTSDASGSYTGWFGFVNTGNSRFNPGSIIFPSIVIGSNTGTILFRYALNQSFKAIGFTASAGTNNGTGIRSTSSASAKEFIALYDNVNGSGRPLCQTYTENEGLIVASIVPFYTSSVEGIAGAWGSIIPNDNANGVKYIAHRSLSSGQLVGCAVSLTGTWSTGSVNTVNPVGGATPLVIDNADAPLTSCNTLSTDAINTLSYCLSGTDIPISVSYTASGTFFAGNIFSVELSNVSGSFSSPLTIGSLSSVALTGSISCLIPFSTPAGTGYRIRVVSSLPSFSGTDNGANITLENVNATASNSGPVCAGQAISFSASGGVSYSWSGPNGFASALQNPSIAVTVSADSGLYSVLVTNANGCTKIATTNAVINNCTCVPPQVLPTIVNVSCNGTANGSVNLQVSGGVAPYSFLWSNGALTQNVSGLAPGNYSVIVSDAIACNDTVQITITEPSILNLTLTSVQPNCNGASTGTITSVASGGTSPYSYQGGNPVISGLGAGTYSVMVTDFNGCTASASATLIDPPPFSISVNSTTNVTCGGGNNGAIDILASNDTLLNPTNPGLLISEYFSNPPGTDSPFEWVELVATKTIDFTITPYTVIVANNGIGTTKGWVQGGLSTATSNATYAFQISTGSVNPGDVVYVGGSQMIVSGTKARVINTSTTNGDGGIGAPNTTGVLGNGTGNADGIAVFNLPVAVLDSNSIPTDAVFYGTAMGTAVVNAGVDGFTLPINDRYNGGRLQSSSFLSSDPGAIYGRATGVYNYKTGMYTTPRVWATSTTFNDGISNVQVVGQNTYVWSNGSTNEDLSNLSAGTYTVTATSPLGCTATTSATITNPPAIQITSINNNVQCFGGNNGAINITVSGGVGPFTYLWNDMEVTEDRSGLFAGSYTVTVTASNGCTALATFTLSQPAEFLQATIPQNTTCFGSSDGAIDLLVDGGTPGYTYLWSTGDTTEDIFNQPSGIYFVTITDAAGCEYSTLDFINDPDPVIINNFTPITGSAGTMVTINGSGFTPATEVTFNGTVASFTIINDGQIQAFVPAGATSGSLTITTAPGCDAISGNSFTINSSATLTITAIVEGYYDSGTNMMTTALLNQGINTNADETDTIRVELREAAFPSNIALSYTTVIHTNGQINLMLPGVNIGSSYYLALFHRNGLQTWSANPVAIAGTTTYDFTNLQAKAFGGNEKDINGKWVMFSGDIDIQDEFIDVFDQSLIDNDASAFAFGYFASDINGDGFVDVFDQAIADNNAASFIFSAHP